jgi:hypothetical protein
MQHWMIQQLGLQRCTAVVHEGAGLLLPVTIIVLNVKCEAVFTRCWLRQEFQVWPTCLCTA